MPDAYLGEIRILAGVNVPDGWYECNGQLLSVRENQALSSLIGVAFGGNGRTEFALPDLRGRVPVGTGTSAGGTRYDLGATGGAETVALGTPQIPAHSHEFFVESQPGTRPGPHGSVIAIPTGMTMYSNSAPDVAMASAALTSSGSANAIHNNVQPFTCVRFIICADGLFPTRKGG
jgi:microcystin-dependent protein